MAMSAAINSKPKAMGSTRKGIFWDDEDDEDEEDYGDSPRLEEGDLQLDFPGDADRPIAHLSWRPDSPQTLRLQPITFRAKVYAVLEHGLYVRCVDDDGDVTRRRRRLKVKDGNAALVHMARAIEVTVFVLIVLNIIFALAATDSAVERDATFHDAFVIVELVSMVLFGVEYLFRWWACVEKPELAQSGPILGRLRWMLRVLPLIDLVAFAAYPIDFVAKGNSSAGAGKVLRSFRVFRIVLLLRLDRKAKALSILFRVFKAKMADLYMAFFIIITLFVVSSTMMYYVEHDAQPDEFHSIFASMWWCASCMTTVGYGDLSPITAEGRVVGILTSAASVLAMALPTCIVGSGFIETMVSLNADDVSHKLTDHMLTEAGWELSTDDSGVWTRAHTQEEMVQKKEEARSPNKAHPPKKTGWMGARAYARMASFRHVGDQGVARLEARLEKVERQLAAIARAVGAHLEE